MSSAKTFSPISKFFSPKGRSNKISKHTKLKDVKEEKVEEQNTQETNVSNLSTELEKFVTESPIKTEIVVEKTSVTKGKDKAFSEEPDDNESQKENTAPATIKIDTPSPRKFLLSPIFSKKKEKKSDPDFKPKKSKKKKKKEPTVDKKQPLITTFLRRSARVPIGEKRKLDQEILESHLTNTDDSILTALKIKTTEEKGRGVYANEPIGKGSFVVEYAGDLVSMDEGVKREEDYSEDHRIGSYIFFFNFKGKRFCLDATAESGRYGRLLNHSRLKPNCKTRLVEYPEGKPRLIIEAKRDIVTDEELLYDYGDRSAKALKAHPWLKS